MIEKYTKYLTETTSPAVGVAAGIIGGTVIANVLVERYLKLTGSQATVGKFLTRVVAGVSLYYYGMPAVTTSQLIAKSAGIGVMAGFVLDVMKQYGFAKAFENALTGREMGDYPTKSEYWKDYEDPTRSAVGPFERKAPIGPFNKDMSNIPVEVVQ